MVQALLDFERTPGRFAVARCEPEPVFARLREVLQLAADRPVPGLGALRLVPEREQGLREAARFFVRTVLLRPGADPTTLLGLRGGFNADTLRDHYRLMIRLTHPDALASRNEDWPEDAAQRINLANDQLQRQLHPPAGQAPDATGRPTRKRPPRPRKATQRIAKPAIKPSRPGWSVRLRQTWFRWRTQPWVAAFLRAWTALPALAQWAIAGTAAALLAWLMVATSLATAGNSLRMRNPALASSSAPPLVTSPEPERQNAAPVSMEQAQSLIVNVMASLQTGQAERIVQWVDRNWRGQQATRTFIDRYNQITQGRSVDRLHALSMRSQQVNGKLIVHGDVDIYLINSDKKTVRRRMEIQLHMRQQNGRMVLTELVTTPSQMP